MTSSCDKYTYNLVFCFVRIYIYTLVINVTAACVRGCAANVGLLVTGKRKENGDIENCKGNVRGGGGGN